MEVLHYFGAALGLGLIVIGAGLGIGRFTAAAAESIRLKRSPVLSTCLFSFLKVWQFWPRCSCS